MYWNSNSQISVVNHTLSPSSISLHSVYAKSYTHMRVCVVCPCRRIYIHFIHLILGRAFDAR